jgi:DNA-binding response OmpR family regulator
VPRNGIFWSQRRINAGCVFLADNLTCDGYHVWTADSRDEALTILAVEHLDVVVVDVNGRTLDLIDAVRAGAALAGRLDPETPMIVLSSRTDDLHRIRVLDRGADDVLAKPFSYPELRARVAAVLRRTDQRRAPRLLRVGELTVDVVARTVRVGGCTVELLSGKEYELLRTLARDPSRTFTRAELLRSVWGRGYGTSRTLDSHAYRLRRKLGEGGDRFVMNVWGVGYRLIDP